MPRRLRIHLDAQPLHLVQRGHNRDACFFADEDYHCYLHWLTAALHETGCALHAYALMTNHVHLLLTPAKAAVVPRLVIALGRRYVQYINKTYRRTGTLWDSRYKSSLVQAETHLLRCMRYIELNPVRAGMVDDPARYRWSSYRHNGLGQRDELLSPHPAYLDLDREVGARRAAYRALFRSELDADALADIRRALNQGQPLGDARFAARICAMTGVRRARAGPGRPAGVEEGDGAGDQGDFGF